MGSAAKSAVPALEDLLKGPDGVARIQAALALWKIDPRTEEAVPVLVSELKNPLVSRPITLLLTGRFGSVPTVSPVAHCWQAADALGQIGPPARAAVGTLTELLRDPYLCLHRP